MFTGDSQDHVCFVLSDTSVTFLSRELRKNLHEFSFYINDDLFKNSALGHNYLQNLILFSGLFGYQLGIICF